MLQCVTHASIKTSQVCCLIKHSSFIHRKVCNTYKQYICAMQSLSHSCGRHTSVLCSHVLCPHALNDFLQDFLGFAPSKQAMAVVQRSTQAHAVQQQQAAASRLQHAAALTAQRCAAAPIYGQDLRQVGLSNTKRHCDFLPHLGTRHQVFHTVCQSSCMVCSV